MNSLQKNTAIYHLPGLFEFYDFYRVFLPLFRQHREYFYDWCSVGSIYGAPADCLWGGGRTGCSRHTAREVLALAQEYGISARLTFSNSLLREEHLTDPRCNALCAQFAQGTVQNGVIVHSDLLLDYLQEHYPELISGVLHHQGTHGVCTAAKRRPPGRSSAMRCRTSA